MVITNGKVDLDEVAKSIVGVFPLLDLFEQRMSLELYCLLAQCEPVQRSTLAERLGALVETVNGILDDWPSVFFDSQQRVVGYWGLAIPGCYTNPHNLTVGGRRHSAWCAWDTLFLPQLLGQTAEIESSSPASGDSIRLTVTPEAVAQVDPAGAHMSFLLPDAAAIQKDVVTTFCGCVATLGAAGW